MREANTQIRLWRAYTREKVGREVGLLEEVMSDRRWRRWALMGEAARSHLGDGGSLRGGRGSFRYRLPVYTETT